MARYFQQWWMIRYSSRIAILYTSCIGRRRYFFTAWRVCIARTKCCGKMYVRPSVRSSVCLSVTRINISWKFFHRRVDFVKLDSAGAAEKWHFWTSLISESQKEFRHQKLIFFIAAHFAIFLEDLVKLGSVGMEICDIKSFKKTRKYASEAQQVYPPRN